MGAAAAAAALLIAIGTGTLSSGYLKIRQLNLAKTANWQKAKRMTCHRERMQLRLRWLMDALSFSILPTAPSPNRVAQRSINLNGQILYAEGRRKKRTKKKRAPVVYNTITHRKRQPVSADSGRRIKSMVEFGQLSLRFPTSFTGNKRRRNWMAKDILR